MREVRPPVFDRTFLARNEVAEIELHVATRACGELEMSERSCARNGFDVLELPQIVARRPDVTEPITAIRSRPPSVFVPPRAPYFGVRQEIDGDLVEDVAGALWATYIVLSSRTGSRFPKADGLALAMGVASLLTLPLGIAGAGPVLADPALLGLGAAVAVLSSVLPYTLEMIALRRLRTETFAILMSLGPAIAACAGLVILGQAMTWTEATATMLVIAASVGAVRTGGRPAKPREITVGVEG